jgi:hypothetical protein
MAPTWIPTQVTPPARSIFYDTFVNNSHGWSLSGAGDNASGYYRILVNNSLILAATKPYTTLVESINTSTELTDYVISADFTINQVGNYDSIGFYLRGDSNLDNDYRIDINGDNTFDIVKEWLDKSSDQVEEKSIMLVPPRLTHLLNSPGQANNLSVIMIGSTIVVSLNKIVAAQISDRSYTNGQVALFAHSGGSKNGVLVSFTCVEIDSLAFPQETPVPTIPSGN